MVPSPRHAWTLGRLLSGKAINGELEELLPPFQAIGSRLATLPLEDRMAAWEAFLDGQEDRAGIVLALADIDPEGPPPATPPDDGSSERDGSRAEPPKTDLPTLPEGTRVKALDRGNYGAVVADYGDRVAVRFISLAGQEATPVLLKSLLAWPDGRPLTEPSAAKTGGSLAEEAIDGRYATLADYARIASDQHWLWEGWFALGVFNAVAAEPGTGKTRFALDLARRLYFKMPWPDGQANELPEGTRTLWVQGDRAFHEMLEAARAFGLPDEAVALGSSPDDPTGSLDLDNPETLAALAERIRNAAPALVVIDTVGMTTGRNLCRPEDARAFFGPLMELAASSGVAFIGLTHLSKDKDPLGRRIVEKARVVIKMTKPDPEGQPNRRRLWVDKTAAVNPPALGVTMGDSGNDYDFTPPTEPEPNKAGRPPEKREKCIEFIRGALAIQNDRIGNELAADWASTGGNSKTFWRAVDDMEAVGELTTDGGPGTGKQKLLHLNPTDPGPESSG